MEVKKLFALASVTALSGFVATVVTVGCSSTEVVTIPNEAGASSSSGSVKTTPKKDAKAPSGQPDDDDSTGDDDDDTTGDDDDTAAPTCLSTDPIDATQYPYEPAVPGAKGLCTAKEVSDLSAYYKAHGADTDFTVTTWEGAVSDTCAKCIFTETTDNAPAKAWAPIVVKDDQIDTINRGGCVEAESGSVDCGQAYQQYQDCTVDACLKDCKTQADFTACRGDVKVLSTSCKGSVDALTTACGSAANVQKYENACKGTTYTFEGPIKVMCLNGPPVVPIKDAGTTKDAGHP